MSPHTKTGAPFTTSEHSHPSPSDVERARGVANLALAWTDGSDPENPEGYWEPAIIKAVLPLVEEVQTLTEERERQFRETTSIHEDLLALGRAVGAPYDGCSSPAGYLHGDIMPKVAALTEERDEARGLHEMSADSVVKLRHELVEAQANEAGQIAKGLQLAAQLDQARALLQQFGTRKPDGQPTTWARAKDVEAFLQSSNEEGPQPLRPNSTVKSI